MKYKIHLKQVFPFPQNPAFCELESDKINCDDAFLPPSIDAASRYNPNDISAHVIGNEFGALCLVFASHTQDALDKACDAGLIDCLMSENQAYFENENLTALGNACELFDLANVWINQVDFNVERDIKLITAIVRAHASGENYIQG